MHTIVDDPEGRAVAAALFDLVQAPIRWQIVSAGLALGLFDRLGGDATPAEPVAEALGLAPRATRLVLDALCAMRLVEKHQDRYRLAAAAAPYLRSDGPRSLGPLLTSLAALRHGDVAALLRGDAPGPALDMADPAFWDRSAASLRSFHRAMGADATVAMLEDLPEWPAVRRLLDLGAGSEVLATTIAARRPDVSVAVLDLPQPAARIAAAVAATPQRDRVDVIPGDFNTVDLGGGYDLIVASMTLYYAADLVAVLARARAALRPGGVLVSVHEGLTDARTAPEEHVVGRLVPVLRGRDLSFDAGAIADAMRDAGFARVARAVVATPFGTMEKTIGRSA